MEKTFSRWLITILLCLVMMCGCVSIYAEKQNSLGDLIDACIEAAQVVWDEEYDIEYKENPGGWGGQPELVLAQDSDILQEYIEKVMIFSGIPIDYDGRDVLVRVADVKSLHINIPELRSLSEQIEQFAKDLGNRQIAHMASSNGERLYEPEVIENIYRFAKWILTLVSEIDELDLPEDNTIVTRAKEQKDADSFSAEPATEVTLPSFRFDELTFSDKYAYTEETDEVRTDELPESELSFVYTRHITNYYDADGNLVRLLLLYDVTRNGELEGHGVFEQRFTRIGDTDFVAVITTDHFDNTMFNEEYDHLWYRVDYKDQSFSVDEEGNLLAEEDE